MKVRLVYIYLAFGLLAMSADCHASTAAKPALPIELNGAPTACHRSIVKISEYSSSPFSKAGRAEGGADDSIIASSDAVPHASVTTITPLTFAVVIFLLNNDKHHRQVFVTAPAKLVPFHKILFRAIIAPNAP